MASTPSKKPTHVIGPDGRERTILADARINEIFEVVFGTPAGVKAMDYLKSITINSVAGPEQSDSALRHLEGGRFIVGLISARINLGLQQKRKAGEK